MRIQTLKRQTRATLALLLFMAPALAGADISAFEFEKRAYHGCFSIHGIVWRRAIRMGALRWEKNA